MTDTNFASNLYEQLSVAGLIGDLQEHMDNIRPGISRNTILLAFKRPGTTPLRRSILEAAKKLLENKQAEVVADKELAHT